VDIVEVHDTVAWYAVGGGGQIELGYESSARPGDRRDNDRADSSSDRITSEHENRTVAAGCRNEPDLTLRSAKRKLQSLRRKQARFQTNSNHCISKRVVRTAKDTGRGIALEELTGIRDRTPVRRRQRARHANWAFAQLGAFVQYKAACIGVPVVLVDPRYTSQTCLACGHVERANRASQARFECIVCGFAGAADAVAACVIAARARAALSDSQTLVFGLAR
jgi:IS605 OrfB family transposase